MYNSYLQTIGAPRARRHDKNVKQRTRGANAHDREGDRGGRTERGADVWSIDQTEPRSSHLRRALRLLLLRRDAASELVHVLHHVLLLLVHQQGEGVDLVHLLLLVRQLALLHALADGRDDGVEERAGVAEAALRLGHAVAHGHPGRSLAVLQHATELVDVDVVVFHADEGDHAVLVDDVVLVGVVRVVGVAGEGAADARVGDVPHAVHLLELLALALLGGDHALDAFERGGVGEDGAAAELRLEVLGDERRHLVDKAGRLAARLLHLAVRLGKDGNHEVEEDHDHEHREGHVVQDADERHVAQVVDVPELVADAHVVAEHGPGKHRPQRPDVRAELLDLRAEHDGAHRRVQEEDDQEQRDEVGEVLERQRERASHHSHARLEVAVLEEPQEAEEDVDAVHGGVRTLDLDDGVEAVHHVRHEVLEVRPAVLQLEHARVLRDVLVRVVPSLGVKLTQGDELRDPQGDARDVQGDGHEVDVVPGAAEVLLRGARLPHDGHDLHELTPRRREDQETKHALRDDPAVVLLLTLGVARRVPVRLGLREVDAVPDDDVAALAELERDLRVREVPAHGVVRQQLGGELLRVLVEVKAVLEVAHHLVELTLAEVNVDEHAEPVRARPQRLVVEAERNALLVQLALLVECTRLDGKRAVIRPDVVVRVVVQTRRGRRGRARGVRRVKHRAILGAAAEHRLRSRVVNLRANHKRRVNAKGSGGCLNRAGAHIAGDVLSEFARARLLREAGLMQQQTADDDVLGGDKPLAHRLDNRDGRSGVCRLWDGKTCQSISQSVRVVLAATLEEVILRAEVGLVLQEHGSVALRIGAHTRETLLTIRIRAGRARVFCVAELTHDVKIVRAEALRLVVALL
mmetsp:Transcript_4256/g.19155  ORF Transcript_4256/g.19155 Transcript_4256/m.19155 type:complete len:863 (+) Transcript_4256:110-2698(+)